MQGRLFANFIIEIRVFIFTLIRRLLFGKPGVA